MQQADAVSFGTLALRSPESHETIIELLKHTKPEALRFFDIIALQHRVDAGLFGGHRELVAELVLAHGADRVAFGAVHHRMVGEVDGRTARRAR